MCCAIRIPVCVLLLAIGGMCCKIGDMCSSAGNRCKIGGMCSIGGIVGVTKKFPFCLHCMENGMKNGNKNGVKTVGKTVFEWCENGK